MDEVAGDVHGDATAGGLGADRFDLLEVAVDQTGPGAVVTGVAALGLIEVGGDDCGMSSVIEAVSLLPVAFGPRLRSLLLLPGGVMMSSDAR